MFVILRCPLRLSCPWQKLVILAEDEKPELKAGGNETFPSITRKTPLSDPTYISLTIDCSILSLVGPGVVTPTSPAAGLSENNLSSTAPVLYPTPRQASLTHEGQSEHSTLHRGFATAPWSGSSSLSSQIPVQSLLDAAAMVHNKCSACCRDVQRQLERAT